MSSIFDNGKFKPIDRVAGKPAITVSGKGVGFSKQTLSLLGYPHFVEIFINKEDKQLAIRPCKENADNAIKFISSKRNRVDALRWNNPTFTQQLRSLVAQDLTNKNFNCEGRYLEEDNAILFDFSIAKLI